MSREIVSREIVSREIVRNRDAEDELGTIF